MEMAQQSFLRVALRQCSSPCFFLTWSQMPGNTQFQASTGNLQFFTNDDGEVEYHDEIHEALHSNARVDYTKPIIRNGYLY